MKSLSDNESVRPSGPTGMDGVLVLILVEIVSTVSLHTGIAIHIFVGVLLTGPLVVKLGSTGYRFLCYYSGSPAFVRRGPPRLPLRMLAPLLLATTLVVIGSGIGLVVPGPAQAGPLLPMHNLSVLVWLPMIAVHLCAYIWRTPRLIADDWRKPSGRSLQKARVGLILATLVLLVTRPLRWR